MRPTIRKPITNEFITKIPTEEHYGTKLSNAPWWGFLQILSLRNTGDRKSRPYAGVIKTPLHHT